MGTDFDVRIITTKKGFKTMNDFIEKELKREGNRDYANALNELFFKKETTNLVLFGWNSINFDSEYTDYNLIRMALQNLEEVDISYSLSVKDNEMQEIHEYKFDSKENDYIYIPIPSIVYKFDDKATINEIFESEKEIESELECDME